MSVLDLVLLVLPPLAGVGAGVADAISRARAPAWPWFDRRELFRVGLLVELPGGRLRGRRAMPHRRSHHPNRLPDSFPGGSASLRRRLAPQLVALVERPSSGELPGGKEAGFSGPWPKERQGDEKLEA